jgi:hypothetical protein
MNPEHTQRTNSAQAKPGLLWCSWHKVHFFLPILPHRITYTARSVSQKENAPCAQVRSSGFNSLNKRVAG